MLEAVALFSVTGGAVIVLSGLVGIASQVRVHQIQLHSLWSWFFRVGMVLICIGLLVVLLDDGEPALASVGLAFGILGTLSGGLVGHHEQKQAKEQSQTWQVLNSLMMQMFVLSDVVFFLSIAVLLL